MKLSLRFFFLFVLVALSFFYPLQQNFLFADSQASWQEIERIGKYSSDIQKKRYTYLIKKISSLRRPSYAESFLVGMLYRKKNICSYGVRWFARAAFQENMSLPASYSYDEMRKYLKKSNEHSPLYEYALFQIASCYVSLNMLTPARAMLTETPALANSQEQSGSLSFGHRFQEEILSLQAKLHERERSVSKAKEMYQKILREFPSPENFLQSSSFYFGIGEREKGVELLFQVLEYPENDSTYIAAVARLEARFSREDYNDAQKVRIAEGYRILKKTKDALTLWKEIDPKKLNSHFLTYYAQNYARLLIDLHNFSEAEKIIQRHLSALNEEEQEQVLQDASRRFFKKKHYVSVLRILPATHSSRAAIFRLQALDKLKIGNREKEILTFARRWPQEADSAKKFFLGVCLEVQSEKKYNEALQCYKRVINLASLTQKNTKAQRKKKRIKFQEDNEAPDNTAETDESEDDDFNAEDACAYYFSGLIYEKQNNPTAAREAFRLSYQNGGGGFYALKALQKGGEENNFFLPALVPAKEKKSASFALEVDTSLSTEESNREIRRWLSYNANNKEKLADFFAAKKHVQNYAVDTFWSDWKQKFFSFEKEAGVDERMGILYYLMGYRYTAERYFGGERTSPHRYLMLQKIGVLTENISLSSWALRAYARSQNKPIDAFFLNPEAAAILYPTPYFDSVEKVSQKVGLDMAVIYALMKQESNYRADAVSSAGARGLMQLMPSTAFWLNKSLKISHLDLLNPDHNILLGASFFYDQWQRLDKDFELTAIAYNAGPGRLREWQKAYNDYEGELFYEVIPISETYHYLRITRKNYDNYKILLDNNFYP